MDKTRKKFLALVLMLSAVSACVPALYRAAFTRFYAREAAILNNIHIHGVPVGGMTKDEALSALDARFRPELESRMIDVTENGETVISISFKELGARYDFTALVEEAFQTGRAGGASRRYAVIRGLSREPREINAPPGFTYDNDSLNQQAARVSEKLRLSPMDARFKKEGTAIRVVESKTGRKLDETAMASAMRKLLEGGRGGAAEAVFNEIPPRYRADDLMSYQKSFIGGYDTWYREEGGSARNINLQTAASRLNNQMLYPGEVFSVSAALGPINAGGGYARATVIVNGKPADDYGGGICQAVTTLYNAVLFSELPVLERHNHSLRVGYADYGFDATVAGDYYDLKFKNDTPHPLLIICEMNAGLFSVDLYGYERHSPGRGISFTGELVETIPPQPPKALVDKNLPPGQTVIITSAQNGYRYDVYKTIYENGVPTGKEKVNTSVYRPVQGVLRAAP